MLRRHPDDDHIEIFVREEALNESCIAGEGPSPDAEPRTGVGVDDHELFRVIERCMPFLQEMPYPGTICDAGGVDWESERMVLDADFCQRHLPVWCL